MMGKFVKVERQVGLSFSLPKKKKHIKFIFKCHFFLPSGDTMVEYLGIYH